MLKRFSRWTTGLVLSLCLSGCIAFYISNIEDFIEAVADWLAVAEENQQAAADALGAGDVAAAQAALDRVAFACHQIDDLASIGREVIRTRFGQISSELVDEELARVAWDRTCAAGARRDQEVRYLRTYASHLTEFCGCPFTSGSDSDRLDNLEECHFARVNIDRLRNAAGGTVPFALVNILTLNSYGLGGLAAAEIRSGDLRQACTEYHRTHYIPQRAKVRELDAFCSATPNVEFRGLIPDGEELEKDIQHVIRVAEQASEVPGVAALYNRAFNATKQCNTLLAGADWLIGRSSRSERLGFEQEPDQVGVVPPVGGSGAEPEDGPIGEPIGEPIGDPVFEPPEEPLR